MPIYRYPFNLAPGQKSIGFMSREECDQFSAEEDFAPLMVTKVIRDNQGQPVENEYRFTPRRPVRAGTKSAGFTMRGPVDSESYVYKPFTKGHRQIRIINLHPGSGSDHLRCTTSIEDFPDAARKYTCLSYVWGSPKGTIPMHLDDGIILITENLMASLWHIRPKSKTIRIWIDALCINQSDQEEKQQQVGMMKSFYEHADSMISWLGPAQSESISVSQDINRLFQASLEWDDNRYTRQRFLKACISVNWVNLRPIFDATYWTRMWIIQEVAARERYRDLVWLYHYKLDKSRYPHAKRKRQWPDMNCHRPDYLLYGKCKISLWSIFIISNALQNCQSDSIFTEERYKLPSINFNTDLFLLGNNTFGKTIDPCSYKLIQRLIDYVKYPKSFALAYRASTFGFRVTQNCDRLFTLAGLYSDFNIEVDYRKPDTEIVLDIAEKIFESLKEHHQPFFLPMENHQFRPSLQGKLSKADVLVSWVPYGMTVIHPVKSYSSVFMNNQLYEFIGPRTDTCENMKFVRGSNRGRLSTLCMYRKKIVKLFERGQDQELREAIAARFGGDQLDEEGQKRLLNWLGRNPYTSKWKQILKEYLDIQGSINVQDAEVLVEIFSWMSEAGHNFGVLSDGNLFVGCEYSRIGDEVVLVEGFHNAFIVREKNENGDVMFVEQARLVGIHHSQVITDWREEMVMV